jgi:hypothetical protein
MRITNLVLALLIFTGTTEVLAQNGGSFLTPAKGRSLSKAEEKIDLKFYGKSYDVENFMLKRVNDTLNVFIEDQKKITITALNIIKLEKLESLDADILNFLKLTDKLGLDFGKESYYIRYSPSTKEVLVKERGQFRYKEFEGIALPVFRHEIVFTYNGYMMELSFFLGEIDELSILSEVKIFDLIKNEGVANNWYETYEKSTFNKDLNIDEDGSLEITTYKNIERSSRIDLGFDLGVSMLGDYFPFNQEISLHYKAKGYNKWVQESNGFFVSFQNYQFLSRPESGKLQVETSSFINGGLVTGTKKYPLRIYYGRLLSKDENDFFRYNKNKFGLDLLVKNLVRVNWELFIGTEDSDWVNSIGVSFSLVDLAR